MNDLEQATMDDRLLSLEPNGERTDMSKVEAEKAFKIPYCFVTPKHLELIKMAKHSAAYGMSRETFEEIVRTGRSYGYG